MGKSLFIGVAPGTCAPGTTPNSWTLTRMIHTLHAQKCSRHYCVLSKRTPSPVLTAATTQEKNEPCLNTYRKTERPAQEETCFLSTTSCMSYDQPLINNAQLFTNNDHAKARTRWCREVPHSSVIHEAACGGCLTHCRSTSIYRRQLQ